MGNCTRNKGHFLWKPMEQMEKLVKHNIPRLRPNSKICSQRGETQ